MDEYHVEWVGGPLDGCAKTTAFLPGVWTGPDLADPANKVVIYHLVWRDSRTPRYVFQPQDPEA